MTGPLKGLRWSVSGGDAGVHAAQGQKTMASKISRLPILVILANSPRVHTPTIDRQESNTTGHQDGFTPKCPKDDSSKQPLEDVSTLYLFIWPIACLSKVNILPANSSRLRRCRSPLSSPLPAAFTTTISVSSRVHSPAREVECEMLPHILSKPSCRKAKYRG